MFTVFFLTLLLLYFWYFYPLDSPPVPSPTTPRPDDPSDFLLRFVKVRNDTFHFVYNGILVWEHVVDDPFYFVAIDKVISKNDCSRYTQPTQIPATGLSLYRYLKDHPTFRRHLPFQQDSLYTAHEGTPFFFQCHNKQIKKLDLCPSGTLFRNDRCVAIDQCTGQPDFQLLPDHGNSHRYYECRNGKTITKQCEKNTFFYYDRCVDSDDLTYHCKLFNTTNPIKLDDFTLFECRNHESIYTPCAPGTQLFERTVCEPAQCVGQPDGARLPLPEQEMGPFRFVPGYQECWKNKVADTVECPQTWDPWRSKGDNLTQLPLVFHGQACVVPSFCENVFSDDPDLLVPVHEFAKDVKNWAFSDQYDRLVGYTCTATGRKRHYLEQGERISKRFKKENACDPPTLLLPLYGQPQNYYDCGDAQVKLCPPHHFFDGGACREEPAHAFKYRGIPFFQFDNLTSEGWIAPWDYPPAKHGYLTGCQSADFELLPSYNLCADPACADYTFLSMIPHFTLLLPRQHQARCKWYEGERHLKKEPVPYDYTFWNQRLSAGPDTCTFGQHLQTGHWIWDRTIFATCDPDEPFVFCPSPHTRALVRDNNVYACAPPTSSFVFHPAHTRVAYAINEMKRIVPPVWDGVPYHFTLNKRDPTVYVLPETGYEIPPKTRFNFQVDRPVHLEVHYRVTHPPHVVFEYTDRPELRSADDKTHVFHVRLKKFTQSPLNLPKYTPQVHVPQFLSEYHP